MDVMCKHVHKFARSFLPGWRHYKCHRCSVDRLTQQETAPWELDLRDGRSKKISTLLTCLMLAKKCSVVLSLTVGVGGCCCC
jgi:hypothetical protein